MKLAITCLLLGLSLSLATAASKTKDEKKKLDSALLETELLIVTVASEETEGFLRFKRSVSEFGMADRLLVLGMGQKWTGGDMLSVGGGQKVRLLKGALEKYKERKDLVIMFTDSYDVIVNANAEEILRRFHQQFDDARVVFSSEGFCWPDKTLATKYPVVKSGKRYLNSGMFMGYASEIFSIVSHKAIEDTEDDQLYYTQIFLDKDLRKDYKIQLDNTAKIFQNLNGVPDDVIVQFSTPDDGIAKVKNVAYNTHPIVIHGNGPSKIKLNELGNYLGKAWTMKEGCRHCYDNLNLLAGIKTRDLPTVTVAVFIEKPTPFLEEFFQRLGGMDYPKSRINLFIHNHEAFHKEIVDSFVTKHKSQFNDMLLKLDEELMGEADARKTAMEYCMEKDCQYYLSVDSEAQLTNPEVLKVLIEQNKPVMGPMLARPAKMWTNFWGSVSDEGFYARSADYTDIVQYTRTGVWNVPFLTQAYLVHGNLLPKLKAAYHYNVNIDPDMSFCQFCRDNGIFIWVDNVAVFGHLVNSDSFLVEKKSPDMFELFNNRLDWELRYLHPNYSKVLNQEGMPDQPCPDVYNFPFFSERMCADLIAEMEHFGEWSKGTKEDNRLAGGYENVPTRDIHMNQIGFEPQFLDILENYVRPMQEKVFIGYYHTPVEAIMNFVVRYKPEEQPSLRPHHDASTYTIDVALNRHGVDYEGGGVRFLRYNCSLLGHEIGWSIIMPGRLTHFHEGLETTKGTRYILISFINP